jgi:hypothetical protein
VTVWAYQAKVKSVVTSARMGETHALEELVHAEIGCFIVRQRSGLRVTYFFRLDALTA